MSQARYYAYRAEGSFAPGEGYRLDFAKVRMDMYAKSVYFPPEFSRQASIGPGPNVGKTPLGLIPTGQTPSTGETISAPSTRMTPSLMSFMSVASRAGRRSPGGRA